MMPHRLTKTYFVVAVVIVFILTLHFFNSSSSPAESKQDKPAWRDWVWPSPEGKSSFGDDSRVPSPDTVKSTPPKFERPPPGQGPISKEEAQADRFAEMVASRPQPVAEPEKKPEKEETPKEMIGHDPEPAKADTAGEGKEGEEKMMKEADCPTRGIWQAKALPALNTTFHVPDDMHYNMKGPKPSEVVIVTASDGKGHNGGIDDILGQTAANRRAYCEHHGYNYHFVNISKFDLENAHPVWKKIPAIVDAFNTFPDAQWVFFLDLDAIIMSPKQDLNSLVLSHAGLGKSLDFGAEYHASEWTPLGVYMPEKENVRFENIDMLVAQDHNGINAGSFFLRRSKFTQWMLDMWADPVFMRNDWPGQEQDTLLHFVKHHKQFRQHLGLIKQRVANAYTEGGEAMKWQPGDLVVHFAGCWVDNVCQERWQQFWGKRDTLDMT